MLRQLTKCELAWPCLVYALSRSRSQAIFVTQGNNEARPLLDEALSCYLLLRFVAIFIPVLRLAFLWLW